eukprot:scaffold288651_cov31-Prasinocladus_malaysianus.AAC.1
MARIVDVNELISSAAETSTAREINAAAADDEDNYDDGDDSSGGSENAGPHSSSSKSLPDAAMYVDMPESASTDLITESAWRKRKRSVIACIFLFVILFIAGALLG